MQARVLGPAGRVLGLNHQAFTEFSGCMPRRDCRLTLSPNRPPAVDSPACTSKWSLAWSPPAPLSPESCTHTPCTGVASMPGVAYETSLAKTPTSTTPATACPACLLPSSAAVMFSAPRPTGCCGQTRWSMCWMKSCAARWSATAA